MSLPERSHPDAATGTGPRRVLYDVITASVDGDAYLEFPPEDPGETVVKQRIFVIEPIPEAPPRYQPRPQDQSFGQTRNVPARAGTRLLHLVHPRTVLLALFRALMWPFLALHRAVMATFHAMYRAVVGTFLALQRGVAATLSVVHRILVGTFVAVHRGAGRTLWALHRSILGTFLMLRRIATWVLLMLGHGMTGTLLVLRRDGMRTLWALRRGVVRTDVVVRRTASTSARWTRSSSVVLIERTSTLSTSGVLWLKRVGGDVAVRGSAISRLCGVAAMRVGVRLARDIRTLGRGLSMVGRHVSVTARSLYEHALRQLGRNAQRATQAREPLRMHMPSRQSLWIHIPSRESLRMRLPLWALKTLGARVPGMNVTLVAFTGGTALGALAMWFVAVQMTSSGLTDRRAIAQPEVVAVEPFADAGAYVATAGIMSFTRQDTATTPSTVPAPTGPARTVTSPATTVMPPPAAVTLPVMTVTSNPVGARVTVDGIGWGVTPVTIRNLTPGQKVVRVTKDGYVSKQQVISVPEDRRSAAIRVTLEARN
jgi:hypothetical protein